jgi:fatty-acyl-CoA synthase
MGDNNQTQNALTPRVIGLVQQLLTELGANHAQRAITLTASLELDLGIGSLEKAELLHRIEQTFQIHLPDTVLTQAETLNDLIIAIQNAKPPSQNKVTLTKVALLPLQQEPVHAQTLLDVLRHYDSRVPERPHIYLQDDQGHEQIITYNQLFTEATALAQGLIHRGLKPGETVALMLPTSDMFFYAFFGVLLAGGVPVPIYPPLRASDIEAYAARAAGILGNAEARFLITFHPAEKLSKLLGALVPSLKGVVTTATLRSAKNAKVNVKVRADDPALIQYTSGSTGQPKGVLLTHRNLLTNIRAYGKAAGIKPDDVVVSWLPLYHDMGLIGSWLGSLYYGLPVMMLSPITFLNHPERWLWAIHYQRATLSAGPNFAYELCMRKIDEEALVGLDLSSWRLALNGAEAIYPSTLTHFSEKFAAYGFKKTTFFPVYGLAECTVALAFPPLQREPLIDRVLREPFATQQQAMPANPKDKDYLEFVCCGKPLPEHEIRIVDEEGQLLEERKVGNLQFRGPSAMQGYYHNPAATQAIYHEGWWDTGDLAYMADGELYITGRKKDLIIKAGRNLYPAEIEEIVGHIPEIRRGCVIAVGVQDARRGTEKLVIIAETRDSAPPNKQEIIAAISEQVANNIGLPPDEIVLVPARTVPKTSSGKLQRSACKTAYLKGELGQRKTPVWLQIGRLFFSSLRTKIVRWSGRLGRLLYAGYIGLLLALIVLPTWLIMLLLPTRHAAKITRGAARLLFSLAGCPIRVRGQEKLSKATVVIFVANHASYLDALVLTAVLPAGVALVAKRELLRAPIIAGFMKKLRHLIMHRGDFTQSLADTREIAETLQQGRSVAIFPEGTFTYATGLRPFKLGAFKLAADTQIAICPLAIRGTRTILRSGSWLPRPGAIHLSMNEPLIPKGNDWAEAIRLRTAARAIIARDCGEAPVDWVAVIPASDD